MKTCHPIVGLLTTFTGPRVHWPNMSTSCWPVTPTAGAFYLCCRCLVSDNREDLALSAGSHWNCVFGCAEGRATAPRRLWPPEELAALSMEIWSEWYSSVRGRLVENILFVVEETCALWPYSIGLWTYRFWHPEMSLIRYIDQFYIFFWIRLESGTAYCLNWRYLHWFDIEITSCVVDTVKFILSKWWEHS